MTDRIALILDRTARRLTLPGSGEVPAPHVYVLETCPSETDGADREAFPPEDLLPAIDVTVSRGAGAGKCEFWLEASLRTVPPLIFNGLTQWRTLAASPWFGLYDTWSWDPEPRERERRRIRSRLGSDPRKAAEGVMEFLMIFGYTKSASMLVLDDYEHPGALWTAVFPPALRGFSSLESAVRKFRELSAAEDGDVSLEVYRADDGDGWALIYCSLTEGDKLLLSRYLSLTTERRILSYHNLGCFTYQVVGEDLWLGITLPLDNPDFSAMFLTDYLCYINPGLRAEDIEVIVRTEDWLALKSVTVRISPDGTALPPVHSLLDPEDVLGGVDPGDCRE